MLFPDDYVLESYARELLQVQKPSDSDGEQRRKPRVQLNNDKGKTIGNNEQSGSYDGVFEEMILNDQRYICRVPQVDLGDNNNHNHNDTTAPHKTDGADESNELVRATDRGLELLRDMEGECMYYMSGWWSYSFCYKNRIKQFHARPPGNGIPSYPPIEDTSTQSFVLGRFRNDDDGDNARVQSEQKKGNTTPQAELQTKGGSRYLVQRLRDGTTCDLTGRDRKIEVQFHCHPQTTDRIGWIKELTTCSYLMVIYTPRLCNDIAFLPPQDEDVHPIECREILAPEDVRDWEATRDYKLSQKLVESALPEHQVIGGIAIGANKLVGKEGKRIEKGIVASIGDDKSGFIAKRENGKLVMASPQDLENYRLELDPEKEEMLFKKLDDTANGKDWSLEFSESQGNRVIHYQIEEDEESVDSQQQQQQQGQDQDNSARMENSPEEKEKGNDEKESSEKGSEETFKDEL